MQINGVGNDNMQQNQIYKTPTRRRNNVISESGTGKAGVDFRYPKENSDTRNKFELPGQEGRTQNAQPGQSVTRTPKLTEMEKAGEYTQNPYATEVAVTGAATGEKSPLIIFWEKVRLKLKTLTDYFSNHFSKNFADNLSNHFSGFFGKKNEASAQEENDDGQSFQSKIAEKVKEAENDKAHRNYLTDSYDSSGKYKKINSDEPTYTERI